MALTCVLQPSPRLAYEQCKNLVHRQDPSYPQTNMTQHSQRQAQEERAVWLCAGCETTSQT